MCSVLFSFIVLSIVQNCLSDDILKERLEYSSKISSYMNRSVDPCDDFYEFCCGNYFAVNKPKLGIGIQSALLNIENEEISTFRELLMKSINNQSNISSIKYKVKAAYQSCMQANIFEFKKSESYIKLIESIGGWPALDSNWKTENFDWLNTMTILQQYGVNFFIKEDVRTDPEFSIQLQPDSFGLIELSREDIDRVSSRPYQINKKIIMKIMEIYGIPKKNARKAFKEILEFGKHVAFTDFMKIALEFAPFGVEGLHTLSNLTDLTPAYNWQKYFSDIAGAQVNFTQDIFFVPALEILETLPDVFKNSDIIRGAANYAAIKLLYGLHREIASPKYPERFCFFQIQKYMGSALSLIYSESKYRSQDNENEAWTVLNYTRNAFKNTIKSSDWLDVDAKRRTAAKLENMKITIGYSNLTLHSDDIEIEYSDLAITPDNFYENYLNLRRHHQKKLHDFLVIGKLDSYRVISPLLIDLNAFYSFSRNQLIIPSVLLIKPYAYPELPKSYNFGSIGRTIGHEMVHSLDSMGKLYNEFAKMDLWWSNESIKAYNEREECFENQYNAYRIPELNTFINGEDSIQENIADNGGIRSTYYGYVNWLKDHNGNSNEDIETLPGLDLTNYQLFFLGFGQMFCSRYNSKKAYKLYIDGTYAVEKYRLIGSLSNFEEFSKHFNCKKGTRMNPQKKCMIW